MANQIEVFSRHNTCESSKYLCESSKYFEEVIASYRGDKDEIVRGHSEENTDKIVAIIDDNLDNEEFWKAHKGDLIEYVAKITGKLPQNTPCIRKEFEKYFQSDEEIIPIEAPTYGVKFSFPRRRDHRMKGTKAEESTSKYF